MGVSVRGHMKLVNQGYLDLQANSARCVTLVMIFLGLGFLIDLCCKGYVSLRLKSLRRSLH